MKLFEAPESIINKIYRSLMILDTPNKSDFYYTTLCKLDLNAAMYPKLSFLNVVATPCLLRLQVAKEAHQKHCYTQVDDMDMFERFFGSCACCATFFATHHVAFCSNLVQSGQICDNRSILYHV